MDLGDLAAQETVELPHGVVRSAEIVAVLAVVGDDHVEPRDGSRRQRGVEEAHVVRCRRPGGQHVVPALRRGDHVLRGVVGLDVVEVQRRAVVRYEQIARPRGAVVEHVARIGRRLGPLLPGDPAPVELVEQIVDRLVTGVLPGHVAVGEREVVVALAANELARDHRRIVAQ